MNFAADLDEFLELHHEHGRFTPTVGELTPNGYRVEVACPCGVTFERWVTPQDAVDDVLRQHLRGASKSDAAGTRLAGLGRSAL